MTGHAYPDILVTFLREALNRTNLSQSDLIDLYEETIGPLPTARDLEDLGYTHSYQDNLMAFMSNIVLSDQVFLVDSDGAYLVDADGALLVEPQ